VEPEHNRTSNELGPSDVTIRIEENTFDYHHAHLSKVCKHLNKILNETSGERNAGEEITLDMDVAIFRALLEFAYDPRSPPEITEQNLLVLLKLGVVIDEDEYIEYTKLDLSFIRNILFELFRVVCAAELFSIRDFLCKHMIQNFSILSQCDEFLEMSFSELKILL